MIWPIFATTNIGWSRLNNAWSGCFNFNNGFIGFLLIYLSVHIEYTLSPKKLILNIKT